MLDGGDAERMLTADKRNRDVIWPFVVGREVLDEELGNRWVIDFQTRGILEARTYSQPFDHLENSSVHFSKS
jgi:hypothetical protein